MRRPADDGRHLGRRILIDFVGLEHQLDAVGSVRFDQMPDALRMVEALPPSGLLNGVQETREVEGHATEDSLNKRSVHYEREPMCLGFLLDDRGRCQHDQCVRTLNIRSTQSQKGTGTDYGRSRLCKYYGFCAPKGVISR